MWGFAYGLLDTLNATFESALGVSSAQAGGLQASYFGAYFVAPLTFAGWIVRKFGSVPMHDRPKASANIRADIVGLSSLASSCMVSVLSCSGRPLSTDLSVASVALYSSSDAACLLLRPVPTPTSQSAGQSSQLL